jgi:hypothetical protein
MLFQSGRDPRNPAGPCSHLADHHPGEVGARLFRGAAVPPLRVDRADDRRKPAQIGEFSFILGALAVSPHTSAVARDLVLAGALISIHGSTPSPVRWPADWIYAHHEPRRKAGKPP